MHVCVHAKSLQSCPALCDPVDYSPPGSSVNGILQARILEWVAMLSSRGPSPPRDWNSICCLLHWQVDSFPLTPPGILFIYIYKPKLFHSLSNIKTLYWVFVIWRWLSYHLWNAYVSLQLCQRWVRGTAPDAPGSCLPVFVDVFLIPPLFFFALITSLEVILSVSSL